MQTRLLKMATLMGLATLGIANYVSAQTITQWNFNTIGVQSAPYNSPAPSTGVGTAITLGMTNNYVNGSGTANTANDDVVSTNGLSPSTFAENAWRIRGTPNNGWANAAPQYSQGIELDTSTVGFYDIGFSFDWYCTTFGIRDLQFQYNLNVSNSAGWTNYAGTSPTGTFIATSDNWYGAPDAPQSTPLLALT